MLAASISERDGIGLGRDVRVADEELAGAGVVSGTELVQLSVFVNSPEGEERSRLSGGRIRRPSRRLR